MCWHFSLLNFLIPNKQLNDFGDNMESVEVNGRRIEYSLIRKNVKNINLRVKRDGSVVVSAGSAVPKSIINKFVFDNADRILSGIEKSKVKNSVLSFEEGSAITLLGKPYKLVLRKGAEKSYFIGEVDIVFYVNDVNDTTEKQYVYDMLLKKTAYVVFPRLIEECYLQFEKICKDVPSLKIKDLKSQWGNCYHKRNLITLNLRLAVYDLNVIRSVVYHEYCHFVYQNHSKDFYNLLSKVCPYWKVYDKVLKNK